MPTQEEILKQIENHYLNSNDFNGINLDNVNAETKDIENLIKDGLISLCYESQHPNPFIKAFKEQSLEKQLEKLKNRNNELICVYPTTKYLEGVIDKNKYSDKPFTLKLTLGEPQLSFNSFDISILEDYKNDPRYYFTSNGINGMICVHDEYYETGEVPDRDQVLLETFGFSFDVDSLERAVSAFLIYLSKLSPEHQQKWNAKILLTKHFLHPIYATTSAGNFPEEESIYIAFGEELFHINEMTKIAYGKPLFKDTYKEHDRPSDFFHLLRPTQDYYHKFLMVVYKMVHDNFNRDFFKGKVELKNEDGKNKASIKLLEEWLKKEVRLKDSEPFDEMMSTFEKIRKERTDPAHKILTNEYDKAYFKIQNKLLVDTYNAVRTIRLILHNHPLLRDYADKIPEWLFIGKICNY